MSNKDAPNKGIQYIDIWRGTGTGSMEVGETIFLKNATVV